jgi:hypothetical protein
MLKPETFLYRHCISRFITVNENMKQVSQCPTGRGSHIAVDQVWLQSQLHITGTLHCVMLADGYRRGLVWQMFARSYSLSVQMGPTFREDSVYFSNILNLFCPTN